MPLTTTLCPKAFTKPSVRMDVAGSRPGVATADAGAAADTGVRGFEVVAMAAGFAGRAPEDLWDLGRLLRRRRGRRKMLVKTEILQWRQHDPDIGARDASFAPIEDQRLACGRRVVAMIDHDGSPAEGDAIFAGEHLGMLAHGLPFPLHDAHLPGRDQRLEALLFAERVLLAAAAKRHDIEAIARQADVVAGNHHVAGKNRERLRVRAGDFARPRLDHGVGRRLVRSLGRKPRGGQHAGQDKAKTAVHRRISFNRAWKTTRTFRWMETFFWR